MKAPRRLIVNADDFGLSPGINRGILRAHEDGIVTSASLMVRGRAAAAAAAQARAHPRLSVGLHLDLCEWVFQDGDWRPRYEVVRVDDPEAVDAEINRQLATFRALLGRDPTHLDSHQHVHRSEPIRSILRRQADRLGVILRGESAEVRYCGDFYGQSAEGYPYPAGVTVAALFEIFRRLEPGTTELGCHPGESGDSDSPYDRERAVECQTLCDPRLRETLRAEGIRLCAFLDWRDQGATRTR